MFDPTIGQWLSEDPIEFEAGDDNLRRYVENNPVSNVDPSGLFKLDFADTFTAAEKTKVQTSINSAVAAAKQIRALLDKEIANSPGGCRCDRYVKQQLHKLRNVMDEVVKWANDTSVLTIYREAVERDRKALHRVYIGGNYPSITVNDGIKGKSESWTDASANELALTMFHELTHQFNTEDDDRKGPLMNAHRIDDLYNRANDSDLSKFGMLNQMRAVCNASLPRPIADGTGMPDEVIEDAYGNGSGGGNIYLLPF